MINNNITWSEIMTPIIAKLEVAANFNGTAQWNGTGAKAMSVLIRTMVDIIDKEIQNRNEIQEVVEKMNSLFFKSFEQHDDDLSLEWVVLMKHLKILLLD